MNFPTPSPLRTGVFSAILFVLVSGLVHAQTWTGGTTGNWSTAANWTPATAPGNGTTALLNDTTANRTIVYDTGASGGLGTLTLTQTSAFLNELDLQKNLTITSAMNLSASGGGTAQLTVDSVGSGRTATFTGGLTVGSGGKLSLLFGSAGSGNLSYTPTVAGNVTLINGGAISVGPPVGPTSSTSMSVTFNNDLTIGNGTLTVDNNSAITKDVRVTVTGNFAATVGTFATTANATTAGGNLVLLGATNSFGSLTFAPNYGVMLQRAGNQTVDALPSLTAGTLTLRGSGTKTVSGTTVGVIGFTNQNTDNTSVVALKLGSNLTLISSGLVTMTGGSGSNATVSTLLGIDANGFTLDMSAAGVATAVWKPNSVGSQAGTVWALTSSAANGVIKARGFDFTSANVTTTVGANLTLESTGGTSIANKLGNGTALDVASTFQYSGSGNATLSSGRSIGTLLVSSGTLQTTGTTFAAATGIEVASGAVLDFGTVALTTPSLTLDINGVNAGQLKTSTSGGYAYSGNLTLNFATTADASLYDLFNFTAGQTPTGDFTSVTLTGVYTGSLSLSGGIWTGSSGASSFSFSQATGDLGVIPEPTAMALLLLGAAGFVVVRFLCRGRRV
jgi:hypothetical protein